MPILSAYGYYFDPNNDRNRYVAMMDFCNWGSFDGGRSWAQYNTGNPFPHNVYVLLCDEKVPGLIWAGASQAHDLPCWKERANPKLGNAGLLTSRDGGRTWTALGPESGLPAGTVTGLVLDPESPPGRRTLFASLFGLGVFRSDDDGKTWRDSSNGIAPEHRRLFRLRRDSSGRLWTVSSMAMPAELYRSDDQGASWRKIFCDPAFPYLLDVVCDPFRRETFYLASFSTFPYHDTDGGIRRSADGGKTWQTILPGVACFEFEREVPPPPGSDYPAPGLWAAAADGTGAEKLFTGFPRLYGLRSSGPPGAYRDGRSRQRAAYQPRFGAELGAGEGVSAGECPQHHLRSGGSRNRLSHHIR